MSSKKSNRHKSSKGPEPGNLQPHPLPYPVPNTSQHQHRRSVSSLPSQPHMPPYNPFMAPPAQYGHAGMPVYHQIPYPQGMPGMSPNPHMMPNAVVPHSSSYDSAFLFPQSSVFASYLQTMQHGQNNYSNYTHVRPPPHQQQNHTRSASAMVPQNLMSVPRGPPKKPKQSGFAIWVGNLPPNTTLIELINLFGTARIQSVFLIQRTLCAFVNYSSQSALEEGIKVFERRGSSIRGNQLVVKVKSSTKESEDQDEDDEFYDNTVAASPVMPKSRTPSQDRYFVCKSLTVEDLYASVRLGQWDTQSHNQATFNEAFKVIILLQVTIFIVLTQLQTSKNVYLIFSANRAGEYFGYARMAGLIPKATDRNMPLKRWTQPDPRVSTAQTPQSAPSPPLQFPYHAVAAALPRVYPTNANPSISLPAGRIVDDSSRGILFWEVEEDKNPLPTDESQYHDTTKSNDDHDDDDDSITANNWTIPFKVQWLSPANKTVPFYKVRTMRNSYNKNKLLKIARDGTEIEPTVGRKLLEMFHE